MVLSEYEKDAIRKAVEQVVLEMHERGESVSLAQVEQRVLNYPPHTLRLKIGADLVKEQEYGRAINYAFREAWELLQAKPHELRRRVTGAAARPEKGFVPEAPRETRAYIEGEGPQVHHAEDSQGITQFGVSLTKPLVVEPLGPPEKRGNIHIALYDPRPESVEQWIRKNAPNPNVSIEAYRAHLHKNTVDLYMDPYRASWDALLRSLPPAKRGEIGPSIDSAKLALKEKMFRDALVLKKIELTDALRVVKPSMNLAEDYKKLDARFPEYFKLYNFSDIAAKLGMLIEILPQDKLKDELGVLAKVVRENSTLNEAYKKDVEPVRRRLRMKKPPTGGGGAGGMAPKRPGEEHHKPLSLLRRFWSR